MKKLFMVYLVFIMTELLPAQEGGQSVNGGHYLGFQFSTGLASYREDLLVPLGFHGPDISLGCNYTYQMENTSVDIRLRLGMGYLQNRYSHKAWVLLLEIFPSWIGKLAEHQKYGQLWGGICIPQKMNNLFFESWDDSHLYWLTAHSLAITTEWRKKISGNLNVLARVDIPFFSWISRPPSYRYNSQDALTHFDFHLTEPNQSLQFETLDDYRALFFQICFKKGLKNALLTIGLEFQYQYCRIPQEIWGLNTSFLLSYQWRIGS